MRTLRLAVMAAVLLGVLWATGPLPASEPAGFEPEVMQDIADLKTQLNSGLRCRRDSEFAFVAMIVQMVDNGDLSVVLVKESFQYARKKKPYPFPYFERVIRIRAAEAGVTIP